MFLIKTQKNCRSKNSITVKNKIYYPTVLVIVQKTQKTIPNIPRYFKVSHCTFGYCTEENQLDYFAPRLSHTICHTFSVVYNSLARNLERKRWIINSLLDVLVWSIAEHF